MSYYRELEALRLLKTNFKKDFVVFDELHNNNKDISIFKYLKDELKIFKEWYYSEGQVFNMSDLFIDLGQSYENLKTYYDEYLVLKSKLDKTLVLNRKSILKKLNKQFNLVCKASNVFIKISEQFDKEMKEAIKATEKKFAYKQKHNEASTKVIQLEIDPEVKRFNEEMKKEFDNLLRKMGH